MPASRKVDEVRTYSVECRAVSDGADRIIEGRVVPFDEWAPIRGEYLERITADTFAKSVEVRGDRIPLCFFHRHDEPPVGVSTSFETRNDGLWGQFRIDMKREAAAEAWRQAEEGFITGMSVGFRSHPDSDSIEFIDDVPHVTRGAGAELREVSMVTLGAYAGAQITKVRTRGVGVVDPRIEATRRWLESLRA